MSDIDCFHHNKAFSSAVGTPTPTRSPSPPRSPNCELEYDPSSIWNYNKPVNARLRYLKRNSFPTSAEEISFQNNGGVSLISSFSSPKIQQYEHEISSRTSKISHRRSNSLFAKCTHEPVCDELCSPTSSKSEPGSVSYENTTITIHQPPGSSNSSSESSLISRDRSFCRRHHHRRDSVAIKFNDPEVVEVGSPTSITDNKYSDQDAGLIRTLRNYKFASTET